jgi:hypothetical protein
LLGSAVTEIITIYSCFYRPYIHLKADFTEMWWDGVDCINLAQGKCKWRVLCTR